MDYYHFTRREIRPLLPKNAAHILEVGAASGATLHWLKTIYPDAETTAVEHNRALASEIDKNADIVIVGDVAEAMPRLKAYDLILLLDVLEHLPDSLETLRRLTKLLAPGGHVIVSLPNVAHLSISGPLLFRRRFAYQDAGILDRTHLRFFVEDTAVALLNDAGLIVTDGLIGGLQGPKSRLLDRLSGGLLRHHLAKQYIMLGALNDGAAVQARVSWKLAE
jgi:2-polyprenyl-3-methyl-5-hydroxy-6-metoxy-1,4-benzoquinol methylase